MLQLLTFFGLSKAFRKLGIVLKRERDRIYQFNRFQFSSSIFLRSRGTTSPVAETLWFLEDLEGYFQSRPIFPTILHIPTYWIYLSTFTLACSAGHRANLRIIMNLGWAFRDVVTPKQVPYIRLCPYSWTMKDDTLQYLELYSSGRSAVHIDYKIGRGASQFLNVWQRHFLSHPFNTY